MPIVKHHTSDARQSKSRLQSDNRGNDEEHRDGEGYVGRDAEHPVVDDHEDDYERRADKA